MLSILLHRHITLLYCCISVLRYIDLCFMYYLLWKRFFKTEGRYILEYMKILFNILCYNTGIILINTICICNNLTHMTRIRYVEIERGFSLQNIQLNYFKILIFMR